ncbi:MAG: molecular chaperone GrpE [Candidatus Azotimanducaceae bacterium]|jgi:molecular chaperone GrpE
MALPDDEATQEQPGVSEILDEILDMAGQTGVSDEASLESEPGIAVSPDEMLEQALADADKFRDMALRAEAEMQNMQRRTAREVENAHKYGLEKFVQNLLPVVDSLEKAVEISAEVSEGGEDAMVEGVILCHKLLVDVLGKEGIEVIDPHGEPFDPQEHQAMSMVENPDMEPNSVCAVAQKGYKMNGRLVRAAMVMVTKAPAP